MKSQDPVVRVYHGPIDGYEKIKYRHIYGEWRIQREGCVEWTPFTDGDRTSSEVKQEIKAEFSRG